MSSQVKLLFFSAVVMGFVSSLMAHRPLWALTELSVLLLSCSISYAFALQRKFYGVRLDQLFMGFVVLICLLKTTQFLGAAAAAFLRMLRSTCYAAAASRNLPGTQRYLLKMA
ncbi:hypothetical protein AO286_17585 [Pseudomonas syringae]|nr:hypothetical protein AO286_17585 [Pseudomonas syringae]